MNTSPTSDTRPREIIISREFDAPRDLVWEAWTNPAHLVKWWGPNGFTTTIHEMDLRPGGIMRHTMHGPDGTDYANKSHFVEVVKPERIVYQHGGGKEGGGPAVQFVATWTFEALGLRRSRLTIHQVFPSPEMRETVVKVYGAIEGGKQTLARLGEFLATLEKK